MDALEQVTQKNVLLLAGSALFADLVEDELRQALDAARQRNFGADEYLFLEGDPAEAVYVLTAGKVKLGQLTVDGQQIILGYLVPGKEFGVIAALDQMVYPVSAQAVGACVALAWSQEAIAALMMAHPTIAMNALRILAQRIVGFQNRIRELATQRVERRIARTVLRLANQTGKLVEEGVLIDLPLTRQDLAEMTGTTQFTVSRTLKGWENQGLIRSKREQITILFPHGLVSIAEDFPGRAQENTANDAGSLRSRKRGA